MFVDWFKNVSAIFVDVYEIYATISLTAIQVLFLIFEESKIRQHKQKVCQINQHIFLSGECKKVPWLVVVSVILSNSCLPGSILVAFQMSKEERPNA